MGKKRIPGCFLIRESRLPPHESILRCGKCGVTAVYHTTMTYRPSLYAVTLFTDQALMEGSHG